MNYISTYLQHQRRLLEESVTRFLTEGKHWPQDYLRTSFDKLKSRFPGIPDDDIRRTVIKVQQAIDSIPAAHEGTWIKWHPKWWSILDFIASKAGEGLHTFDEVETLIDRTLPKIIKGLPVLAASSDPDCSPAVIKTKSFEDFLQTIDRAVAASREVNAGQNGSEYEVVPISSWQQMNSLYGGKTGLDGYGEWCHTEGKGTWNDWVELDKNVFFVIQHKYWQNIEAPDPKTVSSAFDKYGMSLIAILVDFMTGKLLKETLRWNHKKAPSLGESYVDHAFEDSWEKLDKAVGLDVKSICDKHLAEARQKLELMRADPDGFVQQQMRNATEIDAKTIPAKCRQYVTHVIIPDSVTSIRDGAFNWCISLTSITIPGSVKSIGNNAFNWCTSLTGIVIPNSVTSIGDYAFNRCESLTSISIPDSAISVGNHALSWCTSLNSIVIPDSVESIGEYEFHGCKNLTSIMIPDSVNIIGECAFRDCPSLTSIVIPDSVESIGEGAFYYCTNLKSIVIPELVESIKKYAFYSCESLTSIFIPDSVESIGGSTFQNCTNLKSIAIPYSVKSIGSWAFSGCSSLTSIIFKGKTLEEVKSMDFYSWGIDTSRTEIIIQP